jgi:hypothetical protein
MDWMEAAGTSDVPWFPGFKPPKSEISRGGWLGHETEFASLPWYVSVKTTGSYKISLYLHDKPAATPVAYKYAVLELNEETIIQEIPKGASHAIFAVPLEAGNVEFKGWFSDDPQAPSAVAPSYFAYVDLQ